MKILFITSYLEDDPNGVARVSFEMAHCFSQIHETAIICPGIRPGLTTEKSGLKKYSVKSIQMRQINISKLSKNEVRGILDFLEEFSPDIIHSHSPIDLGLIAQAWAIAHDIPYICTIHALPTKMHQWLGTQRLSTFAIIQDPIISFATRKYFLQLLNNATAVVALNKPVFEDIRKLGYEGDLITIPNGFKLDLYQKCTIADVQTLSKKLLYVGTIANRKNQEYLIKVMKYLPKNYHLHLVGGIQDEIYLKKLKNIIEENSLTNVTFDGIIPHYEIPKIQCTSHLFVSASLAEVQSTAILETFASGTPIVALSNQTIDELVDKKTGYNLPQNTHPKQFAQKVKTICNMDNQKYEKLCINARKQVERFDLHKVVEQTEQMYLKYISKNTVTTRPSTNQRLNDLIANIPEGTIKTTIEEMQNVWKTRTARKKSKKAPSLRKLPPTTIILTLVTIAISAIAYFLLANSRARKRQDADPKKTRKPQAINH